MKIFILSSRFPYPIEKGDKLRLYYQIRELSKRHDVILCSLTDTPVAETDWNHLQKFCDRIYLFNLSKASIFLNIFTGLWKGEAAQISYFYRKSIHKKILEIIRNEKPDHIFCQLIRMANYALDAQIPSTLDYMDAFSLGMERRANHSNFLQRIFFKRESNLLAKFEADVLTRFHHFTIIAQKDKSHIEEYFLKNQPSSSLAPIHLISNGIDLNFFHTSYSDKPPTYDLVFVGNMGYFPNITAAQYIIQKILPHLREQYPQLKVLLAGANPSSAVKGLKNYEDVSVSGWVPDIREAYKEGKIFVAPLFTGSGQQNKILEAMAMGIPVITTSIVNQAIGAKNHEEVLLAEQPEDFVKAIKDLLEAPTLRKDIAIKARKFVEEKYSWEASIQKLEEIWR